MNQKSKVPNWSLSTLKLSYYEEKFPKLQWSRISKVITLNGGAGVSYYWRQHVWLSYTNRWSGPSKHMHNVDHWADSTRLFWSTRRQFGCYRVLWHLARAWPGRQMRMPIFAFRVHRKVTTVVDVRPHNLYFWQPVEDNCKWSTFYCRGLLCCILTSTLWELIDTCKKETTFYKCLGPAGIIKCIFQGSLMPIRSPLNKWQ